MKNELEISYPTTAGLVVILSDDRTIFWASMAKIFRNAHYDANAFWACLNGSNMLANRQAFIVAQAIFSAVQEEFGISAKLGQVLDAEKKRFRRLRFFNNRLLPQGIITVASVEVR